MLTIGLGLLALAGGSPAGLPTPPAWALPPQAAGGCNDLSLGRPDVSGLPSVRLTATVPVDLAGTPLTATAFTAEQGGAAAPVTSVEPMTDKDPLSVLLVLDTAAETPAALRDAAKAAAVELAFDLPVGTKVGLVTAGGTPRLALAPVTGRAVATAIGAVAPRPGRHLWDATVLAAHSLPTGPTAGAAVVVLFTGGPDAGSGAGVSAAGAAVSAAGSGAYLINLGAPTGSAALGCSLDATPAALVATVDEVTARLRNRYRLTIRAPRGRSDLTVNLRVPGTGRTATVSLTGATAPAGAPSPAAESGPPGHDSSALSWPWWVGLGILDVLILVIAVRLTGWRSRGGRHRRRASDEDAEADEADGRGGSHPADLAQASGPPGQPADRGSA